MAGSTMTTRQFLVSWIKLILLTALLIGMHGALWQYAAYSIAELLTPKFTPLTAIQEQQFRLSVNNHEQEEKLAAEEKCKYLTKEPDMDAQNVGIAVHEQYMYNRCMSFAAFSWLEHPEQTHKREVIDPMAEKIRESLLPLGFGLLYAIVGIYMLVSLWKWIRATVIPKSIGGIKVIKNRVDDETILWSNRKMSAAVKQLDDLANLFERGMITREILEERKAEIKKALAKRRTIGV